MNRLHERQRAILDFIKTYIVKNGRPPTNREIGKGTGISSTSVVDYHVSRLVIAGFLKKYPNSPRGLVPVSPVVNAESSGEMGEKEDDE